MVSADPRCILADFIPYDPESYCAFFFFESVFLSELFGNNSCGLRSGSASGGREGRSIFGAGSGNFSGIPVLPSMGGTGESPLKGHQDEDEPGEPLGLLSLEERRLWWEITNV